MDESDRFRGQAELCRRLAKKMSLNDQRDALLEMARQWDELADRWEAQMGKTKPEPGGSAQDNSAS
jgi:hypothetical protein